MEPAGALAVAGLRAWAARTGAAGQHLVAVLSGANMNFDRLRFVAERADVGEAREALFARDHPRAARRLPRVLRHHWPARRHRVQLPPEQPARGAHLRRHRHAVAGRRRRASPRCCVERAATRRRISPTMRWPSCTFATWWAADRRRCASERLYRFEFPERPGALMDFLDRLGGRWNISLFHYRNHGSDFGRVLAGFEVPDDDAGDFAEFLRTLGYYHQPEQGNVAYELFLGPGDGRHAATPGNLSSPERRQDAVAPRATTLRRDRPGRQREGPRAELPAPSAAGLRIAREDPGC